MVQIRISKSTQNDQQSDCTGQNPLQVKPTGGKDCFHGTIMMHSSV